MNQKNIITNTQVTIPFSISKYLYSTINNRGVWGATNGTQYTQIIDHGSFNRAVSNGTVTVLTTAINSSVGGIFYTNNDTTIIASNITTGSWCEPVWVNTLSLWIVTSSVQGGGILWSADGITWTQSNKTTNNFYPPLYANGILMVGSKNSNVGISTSLDGKVWTQSSILNKGDYFTPANGNILGTNTWVLCPANTYDRVIYSQNNGTSWLHSTFTGTTPYNVSYPNMSNQILTGNFNKPMFALNKFIVVGLSNNGAWSSDDGITFYQSNITVGNLTTPLLQNGILVAGINNAGIIYSTNGTNYKQSNIINGVYNSSQYGDYLNVIMGTNVDTPDEILFFDIPLIIY